MKNKHVLFFAAQLFIILLSGCNPASIKNKEAIQISSPLKDTPVTQVQQVSLPRETLTDYAPYFEKRLKNWTKTFTKFDLSAFESATPAELSFEDIEYGNLDSLKDLYDLYYYPLLSFSKDSSKFIDIYSYNILFSEQGKRTVFEVGDPEQGIILCDRISKKCTRIAFHGTAEATDEVVWMTDSTFILAGIEQDPDTGTKWKPAIYIGNTNSRKFRKFVSKDERFYQKKRFYYEIKLNSIGIREKKY